METNKPMAVGVVGLHAGVGLQCYFLSRLPDLYRIAWLCDLDERLVESAVAEYPARGTTRLDDVLEDPEVELVTIATPCLTHAELAIQALEAGKHVLVEKPMAASVDEADRMIDAAAQAGKILTIDHQRRFYANHQAVRKVLRDGRLGYLYGVRLSLAISPDPSDRPGMGPDTPWIARFCRGSSYDYFCHHVDQMTDALGERPTSLYSRVRPAPGRDVPQHWEIHLNFPSGVVATVDVIPTLAPVTKWTIYGQAGTLAMEFENDMGPTRIYQPGDDKPTAVTIDPPWSTQEGYTEFYRRLHAGLVGQGPLPVTAQDGREAIRILWLALESAKANRVVSLSGQAG